MRILLYGSNYSPELTGVGKYTGEMARWLVHRGHEVTVVTAPPHYPEWVVKAGYHSWCWTRRVENGVIVWRCPTWIPARPGGLTRVLHLASFAVSSFPIMLNMLRWRPDLVWVVEPPLLCAPAAALVGKIGKSVLWLHIQDFEVDAAFKLGLLRGRLAKSFALRMERWLMLRFDAVSTISGRMVERLQSKGVQRERIVSFPNWVDVSELRNTDAGAAAELRTRLRIPAGSMVALYSGNMGRKQGLELLAEVAKHPTVLTDRAVDVHFVFCGNGVGREKLEQACAGLANVRFLDLQPISTFPVLLAMADVHLLPQVEDASDLVMPSKLTGIMASGRPVVAAAGSDTELGRVAAEGGLVVSPEDAGAMAAAIMRLARDSALRTRLGEAAADYARDFLDRDHVLGAFERSFTALVRASRKDKQEMVER